MTSTDRLFVLFAAIASGLAILLAVNALLALFFDEDMRRRKRRRVSRPGGAQVNGAAGRPLAPRSVPNPVRPRGWR